MAAGSHFVKKNQNKKLHIDLKWPEMRSNVNFGHPKRPTSAILSKFAYRSEMAESEIRASKMAIFSKISKKNKIAYQCEMDRNEIESDFRTSKMAAGSHFVKKKLKLHIDLKWSEMRSKVNFGHPKWPTSAILSKM